MKRILKIAAVLLALALVMGSCDLGGDNGGGGSGVDFTNYGTSANNTAIYVRNDTNQTLVAFKGSLNVNNILGGVPANAQDHGLKKNPALFTTTDSFPMILITEEQYIATKGNPSALSQLELTPFTRVYVFYNASGDNNIRYRISNRLGGKYKLTVENPTNLNVELRLGGVDGETIGYAPSGMLATSFMVNDGDFNIFPVFKSYNNLRDIVETIYPTGATGYPWFQPLGFADQAGMRDQLFNVKTALGSVSKRSSGVAWLSISNQTAGAIQLYIGNTVQRNSAGVAYFPNSGEPKVFQIDMPTVAGSTSFAEQTTISNYKVGPTGFATDIKSVDGGATNLVLKADYMYTVIVTGSHNDGDLAAVVEMREGYDNGPVKITFDGFAMNN
jgi:hypothetical protein